MCADSFQGLTGTAADSLSVSTVISSFPHHSQEAASTSALSLRGARVLRPLAPRPGLHTLTVSPSSTGGSQTDSGQKIRREGVQCHCRAGNGTAGTETPVPLRISGLRTFSNREAAVHPTGPEGFAVLSSITQTEMFVPRSQPKPDEIVLKCSVQGGQGTYVGCAAEMNTNDG